MQRGSSIRKLALAALAVCMVLAGGSAIANGQATASKPNILFIMGDDIGWMQPSIYHRGLMVGKTPNIDRIGNEGGIFMHYYAMQSCTSGRNAYLEAYAGASIYPNHGERVVRGTRLMQSASDPFLGWTEGRGGRHFYIRQLRDMKTKILVELFEPTTMIQYAEVCGYTLARAHARSGDSALISGYLERAILSTKPSPHSRLPVPTRANRTMPF
jgi:hypothetical protein